MNTSARAAAAGALALLLVVLTPVAVAGAWVRAVLLDTNRYVATTGPLIDDPVVRDALAEQVSNQVVDALDVESLLDQALESLPFGGDLLPVDELLAPLVAEVESLVRTTVTDLVAGDEFAAAWQAANRVGHEQVVGALTGRGSAVTIDGDEISIPASVVVDAMRSALVESGREAVAALVPDVDATFVVYAGDSLPTVQGAVWVLDAVGSWMWVVVLVLGAGVVLLMPRRLVGLVTAAAAVVLGVAVLVVVTASVRTAYLAAPQALLSGPARAVVFDQVTAGLRTAILVVLIAAGVVLVVGTVLVVRRRDAGVQLPVAADQSP